MDDEVKDSPLERLRKRLYAQQNTPQATEKKFDATRSAQEPQHWQPDPLPATPKKRMSLATTFLLFAAGFFVIAGLTTAGVLFFGGRSVSSDLLAIAVEEGPVSVPGGKATSFTISLTNNNPLPVTRGTVTLLFPEGTVDPDDASVRLTHYTEEIGPLAPGETIEKQVRAAFFGTENQRLSVPITVEYETENSNATFTKKITHSFTISSSPVTLTATALKEISPGQPATIRLSVRSNASEPLNLVAIKAEYPFGFSPTNETPTPLSSGLFVLETLAPGQEIEIRITGPLYGEIGEERVFRFTAGQLKSIEGREFGVPYMVTSVPISIAKPFLAVDVSLNREESDPIVVATGEQVAGLVSWENTLDSTVSNARITVTLSGDALDPESVEAVGGFYRSSDRTIVFDKNTSASLGNLQPNDTGNGSFTFRSKVGSGMNSLRNPTMKVTVSVSGQRLGAGRVPETITSSLTRDIRVHSDLSMTSRIVRTTGPFTNTGPWPPEADKETTYTVLLSASNTVNSVANAQVRFTLPAYVRFMGNKSGDGSITYNESTREVLWTVGDMGAGSQASSALQIGFLPSISQKGTSPILVSTQAITGYDRFAGGEIGGDAGTLTTQTTTDPAYQSSYGAVLQ